MSEAYLVECRRFVRPAVIEHLRHWWGSDGLFHQSIRNQNGRINPEVVRQIFSSYGVSRGLRTGNEVLLASVLDDRLREWPDNLLDRAKLVRDIAVTCSQQLDGKGETITKGVLLSGMSKVVWFANPEGWTLYDSFARRGLGAGPNEGGRDQFDHYYRRLDFLKFNQAMDFARESIIDSAFPYLWPERIHDKYLMLCGHVPDKGLSVVGQDAHEDLLRLWAGFHGQETVQAIEDLVDSLVRNICDHQAFQVHTTIGRG